jgi:hypothetical protein
MMVTFRARQIYDDSVHKLIMLERVEYWHYKTEVACYLQGGIKPIAILHFNSDGLYSLDMQAEPITIDRLRQDIPDFDVLISSC